MFDDQAVHVGDPECAVGSSFEMCGAEPIVGRAEKLGRLLVRVPMPLEADAFGVEQRAGNQVVDRLADEDGAVGVVAERCVAEDLRAAGGCVAVFGVEVVEAIDSSARRIHPWRWTVLVIESQER